LPKEAFVGKFSTKIWSLARTVLSGKLAITKMKTGQEGLGWDTFKPKVQHGMVLNGKV
jgi:hypothetical protein